MKSREERGRVTVAAEITLEQRDVLKKLSSDEQRSVSWLFRDALSRYLDERSGNDLRKVQ